MRHWAPSRSRLGTRPGRRARDAKAPESERSSTALGRGLAQHRVTRRCSMDTATPLSADRASASGPRVLVVDDQAAFRDVARQLLEHRGYAVVAEAGCAATALDAVERFAPEAVLLDLRLGDDNGFDVCRTLTRALLGSPCCSSRPTTGRAPGSGRAAAPAASSARRGSTTLTSNGSGRATDL